MEQLRAISRFFSCSSNLRRRTSLILRMDNLLAGIRFLLEIIEKKTYQQIAQRTLHSETIPDCVHSFRMLSTGSAQPTKWTTSRRNPWTTSSGIGGQLRPESVDNLLRNTHQNSRTDCAPRSDATGRLGS